MQLTFQEWLESRYRPIMGGDTPPAPDPPTPAPGEGDDPADPPADPEDDADPPADPPEDPGDADVEELDRIKRERDEARERVARAEAAAEKAKKEARDARREAAKKGGNWEQVAREREAELQEANEARASAERDKVTAQEDLDNFRREVRVTRISTLIGFRDPQDALNHLARKPESTGDDKSCMRALRTLAQEKPYLVDPRKATGRSMANGGNGQTELTWQQVSEMSESDIIANWDKVQPVLERGPGG